MSAYIGIGKESAGLHELVKRMRRSSSKGRIIDSPKYRREGGRIRMQKASKRHCSVDRSLKSLCFVHSSIWFVHKHVKPLFNLTLRIARVSL